MNQALTPEEIETMKSTMDAWFDRIGVSTETPGIISRQPRPCSLEDVVAEIGRVQSWLRNQIQVQVRVNSSEELRALAQATDVYRGAYMESYPGMQLGVIPIDVDPVIPPGKIVFISKKDGKAVLTILNLTQEA